MTIRENIVEVKEKINKSTLKINKSIDDIKIVAVTKYVDSKIIRELYENGLVVFGESKVQDFIEKYDELGDIKNDIKWHFIGHLQRNKVKYIIDKVDLIHSVDNIKLIAEIDKQSKKCRKITDILLQVNISEEISKYGFKKGDLIYNLEGIDKYKNIRVNGLMAMASNTNEEEIIRNEFKQMKEIFDNIGKKEIINSKMKYLSLGMSNDFELAIEEGANIVRIGKMLTKD